MTLYISGLELYVSSNMRPYAGVIGIVHKLGLKLKI